MHILRAIFLPDTDEILEWDVDTTDGKIWQMLSFGVLIFFRKWDSFDMDFEQIMFFSHVFASTSSFPK